MNSTYRGFAVAAMMGAVLAGPVAASIASDGSPKIRGKFTASPKAPAKDKSDSLKRLLRKARR